MDKREFYKELMTRYTVDTEKIKYNAKRRRVKKKNTTILRIGAGCAAAAAAVAITAVSLNTFGKSGEGMNLNYVGGEVSAEEAAARMQAAEKDIAAVSHVEGELLDMYVSLEEPMSKNEIMFLFSAVDQYGEIKLRLLYAFDGAYTAPSDAPSEEKLYTGVKITAPASLCRDIRMHRAVSLVELAAGGITDDSFIPFGNSITVFKTDPPFSEYEVSLPNTGTTTAAPDTETQTSTQTSPTQSESSAPVTDPEITTPASSAEESIGIPVPATGVKTVNIISKDRIIVTTSDSIRLFRLENDALVSETVFYASNAKIIKAAADGSVLYITACDSNSRNRLYLADGNVGTLAELDISKITADGSEIAFVGAAPDGVVIKTVSLERSCVYSAKHSDGKLIISLAGEYTTPVSPIAFINGVIYNAVTDGEGETARIFSVNTADGSVADVAVLNGAVRWTGSPSFNSAMLTVTTGEGSECYLFLAPDGQLIDSPVGAAAFAPLDSSCFTDGSGCYTIKDGAVVPLSEEEASPLFADPNTLMGLTCDISEDGTARLLPLQ